MVRALALLALGLLAACDDSDSKTMNTTMNNDGYALFQVKNDNQQRDNVTVTVDGAVSGASYVLLYSPDQPTDTGWFQFDPTSVQRCGGEIGPHCAVPGYGYMVDSVTVPATDTIAVLRDERCGCGDDNDDNWTGHWAVMRIERTPTENSTVSFHVDALQDDDNWTSTPKIAQLQ